MRQYPASWMLRRRGTSLPRFFLTLDLLRQLPPLKLTIARWRIARCIRTFFAPNLATAELAEAHTKKLRTVTGKGVGSREHANKGVHIADDSGNKMAMDTTGASADTVDRGRAKLGGVVVGSFVNGLRIALLYKPGVGKYAAATIRTICAFGTVPFSISM